MVKRHGEIVAIKDLFTKYRLKLYAPQKTVELMVIKVVGEMVGLTLEENQVEYNVVSRIVIIKAPGLIKQEVLLQQARILPVLKQELGEKGTPKQIL